MLIQFDISGSFLKRLKYKNWKQNGGYAIRGNPRVLERSGRHIAVVKPITIDPKKLQEEVDKFFKSLIDIIRKNGIKDVFIPGGGTIPIPQFFLDFCRENGINIHVLTLENFDQYELWGE